ncbi:MAG: cation:dicarboxylase symporter family transporter [Pseudomonadota bacterium]
MSIIRKLSSVGLPYWIVVGAVLGCLIGILFGDYASVLSPFGEAYVGLLQMVVYPYIVSSLLHGLGRLKPNTALRLLKSGIYVFALAAVGIFATVFILGLAIPQPRPPVVVHAGGESAGTELISLLIPSNPVTALVDNYVPAVVLLSVIYGIAIQRFENTEGFLSGVDLVKRASAKIWSWVTYVAPLGVLALFADLAGSIYFAELGGIVLYLVLFCLGAILLAFIVIPLIATSLVPIGYREMLSSLKTALIMSVSTSLLVTCVPYVVQFGQQLVARLGVKEEDRDDVVATTVAVAYAIAEMGNWFLGLFILFASQFYDHALSFLQHLLLPFMTILSTVGSPTATVNAVEFLGGWIGLPSDATFLYVETSAVTRYPQILLSAMGLALLMMTVVLSYFGKLRIRRVRLLPVSLVSLAVVGGLTTIGVAARPILVPSHPNPYLAFTLPASLAQSVDVHFAGGAPSSGGSTNQGDGQMAEPSQDTTSEQPTSSSSGDGAVATMDRVRSSGTLRVGYNTGIIPFCYLNSNGDLVGYDVELVYALARDLNVSIEFIPFDWESLAADLQADRFDFAIGGIFVTNERLANVTVSDSIVEAPITVIAPADGTGTFLSRELIADGEGMSIAAFRDPVIVPLADDLFPAAHIEVVETYDDILGNQSVSGALWTLPQARAWAETHPGYSAVVPNNLGAPLPIAYLMPPNSPELLNFVNYWLGLRQTDGYRQQLQDYWIDGKPRSNTHPRWSVMRNVLHWIR